MNDKFYVRDVNKMLQHPQYKAYWETKQEILSRYPPIKERSREEHQRYMKELGDEIWRPDGPFQQWVWDTIPDCDREIMERAAMGRKRRRDTI